MKTITTKLRLLIVVLLIPVCLGASELTDKLSAVKAISDIKAMTDSSGFAEKYTMKFTHPLDYKNPAAGNFTQRIFVCHVGFDRPTIVVTEGYWANYAENPKYREELSRILNANLVVCEYRYFGQSVPTPCNWNYLTVENSLDDIHQVVTALKKIYPKKWLATGISKGGQTTMFYRAYFPNDVAVSVPYVAPLNKSLEDGRHEPFIANKPGSAEDRMKVRDFQIELCKRKSGILPYFEKKCEEKKYKFRVPVSEIYDYWILEYSFAFWQWGTETSEIPAYKTSNKDMADFMFKFNDPSYFQSNGEFLSFWIQAAKELGYYGYDVRPFSKYMKGLNTKNYLLRIMLPARLSHMKFSDVLYKKTVAFLKNNDPRMIYIYGQYDPWSASGVCSWLDTSTKKNLHIYIQPRGCHKSRIANMPEETKEEIIALLKKWME